MILNTLTDHLYLVLRERSLTAVPAKANERAEQVERRRSNWINAKIRTIAESLAASGLA